MKIPLYLAVAQWALLLTLGLLVVGAYRQLGRVFADKRPTSALGPVPGSRATEFVYLRISDNTEHRFRPAVDHKPTLLGFVDPTCPACEELVENLSTATSVGELDGFRTLLVMSDPPTYAGISTAFRSTGLEIGRPPTDAAREAYNAAATPLLVAIDSSGTVRAARSVVGPKDIRVLMEAAVEPSPTGELGVAVIRPDEGAAVSAEVPATINTGGGVT
jgi:hypothetical protein